MKFLCFCFYIVRNKNVVIDIGYKIFKQKSFWWLFFSSLLETSLAKLTFNISIQGILQSSF